MTVTLKRMTGIRTMCVCVCVCELAKLSKRGRERPEAPNLRGLFVQTEDIIASSLQGPHIYSSSSALTSPSSCTNVCVFVCALSRSGQGTGCLQGQQPLILLVNRDFIGSFLSGSTVTSRSVVFCPLNLYSFLSVLVCLLHVQALSVSVCVCVLHLHSEYALCVHLPLFLSLSFSVSLLLHLTLSLFSNVLTLLDELHD